MTRQISPSTESYEPKHEYVEGMLPRTSVRRGVNAWYHQDVASYPVRKAASLAHLRGVSRDVQTMLSPVRREPRALTRWREIWLGIQLEWEMLTAGVSGG